MTYADDPIDALTTPEKATTSYSDEPVDTYADAPVGQYADSPIGTDAERQLSLDRGSAIHKLIGTPDPALASVATTQAVHGPVSAEDIDRMFRPSGGYQVNERQVQYQATSEAIQKAGGAAAYAHVQSPEDVKINYIEPALKAAAAALPKMYLALSRLGTRGIEAFDDASMKLVPDSMKAQVQAGVGDYHSSFSRSVDIIDRMQQDVDSNFFAGPQNFPQRLARSLGTASAMVALSPLIGTSSTAILFALQNGADVGEVVERDTLAKGGSQDEARNRGLAASVLTLPVSYALNTARWANIAERKFITDTVSGKATFGALNFAGTGLAQREYDNAVRATVDRQGFKQAIHAIDESTGNKYINWSPNQDDLIGAITGAVIHQVTPSRRRELEGQMQKDFGVLMDVGERGELHRVLREELKLEGPEHATAAGIFDYIAMEKARKDSTSLAEVYSKFIANVKERGYSGVPMFQKSGKTAEFFLKSRELLHGEEYTKAFGEKPADASSIWSYLKTKLKPDELEWTGLNSLFKHATDVEAQEGATPVKISRKELSEYIDKQNFRLVTVVKGNKQGYQEHIDALNDLYRQIHEIDTKLVREQDEQKRQQLEAEQKNLYAGADDLSESMRAKGLTDGENTRFESVTAPGPKENYEEWLLRVPFYEDTVLIDEVRKTEGGKEIGNRRIIPEENLSDAKASAEKTGARVDVLEHKKREYTKFEGAHWSEDNVIVHIRVDQRMTSHGPVLFVNEVQSDWGQKGDEFGFVGDEQKNLKEVEKLHDETISQLRELGEASRELASQKSQLTTDQLNKGYSKLEGFQTKLSQTLKQLMRLRPDTNMATADIVYDMARQLRDNIEKHPIRSAEGLDSIQDFVHKYAAEGSTPAFEKGPYVTTTEGWLSLALKHILLEATNRNIPRVAFASGELQDRFQGVVDEEQSQGRKKFYDEILPKALEEVLRKEWGWKKGLEVVEVNTEKQLNRQMTHEGRYQIFDQRNGDVLDAVAGDRESEARMKELAQDSSPVLSIELPQPLRETIFNKGASLFQSNRASVTFTNLGKAIFKGLNNPDFSSAMHEFAHVFLRGFVDKADLQLTEKVLGVKNGFWTTDHEETFARAFEKYIMTGKAPAAQLVSIFEDASGMMKKVYKAMDAIGLTPKSSDLNAVMDRLFLKDSDPVKLARQQLQEAELNAEMARGNKKEGFKPASALDQARAESYVRQKQTELRLALERQQLPHIPSHQEILFNKAKVVAQAIDETDSDGWGGLSKLVNNQVTLPIFRFMKSEMDSISNSKVGRWFARSLNTLEARRNEIQGTFDRYVYDTLSQLDNKDRDTLGAVDENRQGELRRIVERVGTVNPRDPQTKAEQRLVMLIDAIQNFGIDTAKSLNMMRRMASGDVLPVIRSEDKYLPRLATIEGRTLMKEQSGPMWKNLVDDLTRMNPGWTPPQIESTLKEMMKSDPDLRRFGSFESVRKIKYWPDVVHAGENHTGAQVAMFHYRPAEVLSGMIGQMSTRLALTEHYGQGMLKDVADPNTKGYRTRLTRFAEAFGHKVNYDNDKIRQLLWQKGVDKEQLYTMKGTELRKLAKDLEVPTAMTNEDLLQVLSDATVSTFELATGKDKEKLQRLAKQVGGVDSRGHVQDVINGIRDRLTTRIEDDIFEHTILAKAREEGVGNISRFVDLFRQWQRIPLTPFGQQHFYNRFVGALFTPIGAMHTSLSLIPNIPQTLLNLKDINDIMAFGRAHYEAMSNFDDHKAALSAMGVLHYATHSFKSESSYQLTNLARAVREGSGMITGTGFMNEYNEVVTGLMGKEMAERWFDNGLKEKDVKRAQDLGLEKSDIEVLRKKALGQLTEADRNLLFKKIIQRFVAASQGTTEAPQNRSMLENNPYLKLVFNYKNYTSLATRTVGAMVTDLRDSIKGISGAVTGPERVASVQRVQGSILRTILYMTGAVGAGLVAKGLKGDIKGTPPDFDNDDWYDKLFASMLEVQVFGFPTTMYDPFQHSGGNIEKVFTSFMPQINTLLGFLGSALGMGRYGRFPVEQRLHQWFTNTTPAYKALKTWADNEAHPEIKDYREVRSRFNSWEKQQPNFKPQPGGQLEPDYDALYNSIIRGDQQAMQEASRTYYKKKMEEGNDPAVSVQQLRASLLARKPIGLSEDKLGKFMRSVPEEQRQRYMQTYWKYVGRVNQVAPSGR